MYLYYCDTDMLLPPNTVFSLLLNGYFVTLDSIISVLVLLLPRHTQVYDMLVSYITVMDMAFLLRGSTRMHAHVFLLHR